VTFDRRQEGAPGFAHGGAVATVLDDALGTVLILLKRPAVTANLNVDFRAPTFLDHVLVVEAWCESIDDRKLHLAGELRDGDEVIAAARGLFIEVGVEHFNRGGHELPANWGSLWSESEA
jgi:acyl-coenzyme A thioesterase PaaI-like protein